jgi:acyl-CoA thioesterase-1
LRRSNGTGVRYRIGGTCGAVCRRTGRRPGEAVAAGSAVMSDLRAAVDPASLPAGALYRNPANGRDEVIVGNIAHTALLIGDSQSEPQASWPRRALAGLGYDVFFCGKGGTGYVASNGTIGNYVDALQRGDWHLPYGFPPLVVIEGGGNDAKQGASDEQISANATRLITTIKQRYPGAKLAMVGTLGKGADHGGARRAEVDALLGPSRQTKAFRSSVSGTGSPAMGWRRSSRTAST